MRLFKRLIIVSLLLISTRSFADDVVRGRSSVPFLRFIDEVGGDERFEIHSEGNTLIITDYVTGVEFFRMESNQSQVFVSQGKLSIGSSGGTATDLNIDSSGNFTLTSKGSIRLQNSGGTLWTWPVSDGTSNQVLTTNGSGTLSWSTGGTTSPGGSNTQVQYNSSGSFAGSSGLTLSSTQVTGITLSSALSVANGGTGLASGTSGGILGYTASGTLASSAALTANAILLGGGAGVTPTALSSLGTTTTLLHGNASGAPTFGAVSMTADVSGTLPVGNGGSGATSLTGLLIGNGASAFTATTLSSGISGQLSDETGTGVLMFGTSPTITTGLTISGAAQPAITLTPSAGDAFELSCANSSYYVKDSTNGTELFRVEASPTQVFIPQGKLSVGTTDLNISGSDNFTISPKGTFNVQTGGATQVTVTTTGEVLFNKSVGFPYVSNGSSGTARTIDWRNSVNQTLTLTGNATLTFTAPANPGHFTLVLIQDSTGSRTVTWPGTVKWAGAAAPTLTTTASAIDLVSFFFDGTTYYGAANTNFA